MKTSEKNSVKRTFLSKERNALSEERTALAYIRTELAVIGVVALILKFYFEDYSWSLPFAIILFVVFGILIIYETFKIKKLRNKRRELQKKEYTYKRAVINTTHHDNQHKAILPQLSTNQKKPHNFHTSPPKATQH